MKLKENKFKRAIKSGTTQYGLWMGLVNTSCAEIGAGAGFDWVLIDAEHAAFSVGDVQSHLQAIEPYNVPVLVRPKEGDTALIKQLLDVGAQTLLVPMVETADEAKSLARDMRYPPEGIRGLGTSMARAARWNRISDYVHTANKEVCLIVQVETVSAMENLSEIVLVKGIDGVFIGPSDLSASMGFIGQPGHPEVVAAIEKGFKIIINAGKAAGVLAVDPKLAQQYAQMGVNFIGVGVDAALLSQATTKLAEQFINNDNGSEKIAGY